MRVALIGIIAVLLSFAADTIALPRSRWRRVPLAWALHILAALFQYAFFMLLSARPVFSAFCMVGLLAITVVSSNPKFSTLREPMVFSDLYIYTDIFRNPRFYLPFLNIGAVAAIGVGIAVLALGYWAEPPVTPRPWLMPLLAMALCLVSNHWIAARLPLTLDAVADQKRHGFFTVFTAYLINSLRPSTIRNFQVQTKNNPFSDSSPASPIDALMAIGDTELPDIIVIQSESYFDIRRISSAINPSIYAQFDRACRESVAWGKLTVPAWGANTMRSEFSFLTGLPSKNLGYPRFYPYAFLRSTCASLPGLLQRRGYHTLALHPYHANFFGRDRVFPLLHFNRFLDITHFEQAPRAGPYVADTALADTIFATLDEKTDPAPKFIFALTMESHGPLHLETVSPGESASYHTLGEDPKWAELTIYLRHAINADTMIGKLLDHLRTRSKPIIVCFYGDHVPALSKQFQALGVMPKHSEYFIWRNFGAQPAVRKNIRIEALGPMILAAMRSENTPNGS
jgi:phosphoglycerol transferase MdoB-like AlkP superfamily enzyme